MAVGIGAASFLGIAFEVTPNTYVAPTKFFPIKGETLQFIQDTIWWRPVRGNADVNAAIPGNVRIEGEINAEILEDMLAYFLYAGRWSAVKTGTTPNFTYTFTPTHTATTAAGRTLSITVVRNDVVFGYVGCVIHSYSFTVEDGLLVGTFGVLGSDETVQSAPVPTFPTTIPFGAGQYSIEIPTATPVEDTDTFTLEVDNNGEAQYRLRNPSRGAKFIKYGQRAIKLMFERDFESRTEYDAYKALTSQSVTVTATKSANNSVSFLIPKGIRDAYEITGDGTQEDLIRANLSFQGVYDAATSKAGQITVKTQEDIT